MKAFKKKTLALVLASVVSIAGSFATGNYKNTLLGLDFAFLESNPTAMHMFVQTRINYAGSVSPTKKDANTYVLMLPEVESKMTVPDITKYRGLIKDISIRTMPYTNTGKGYTKITITTDNVLSMSGYNRIFIPTYTQQGLTNGDNNIANVEKTADQQKQTKDYENIRNKEKNIKTFDEEGASQQLKAEKKVYDEVVEENLLKQEKVSQVNNDFPDITLPMNEKDSFEVILLVLGAFLVIMFSAAMFLRAKDRLREIAGENVEIDVTENDIVSNNDKKTNDKKIRETIKKLDNAYAKTTASIKSKNITDKAFYKNTVEEELNIVDLDELFKETVKTDVIKKQTEEEENLALEEFLSGFSFDEELVSVMENSAGYDVEFYEELLNSKKVFFTKKDVECINKILNSEIKDSTLQNIDSYLMSNPIKKELPKEKILEEIISTYTISQNILFKQSDIIALKKLMSVELDSDFVTDLRTNPERVEKMRKEIENFNSELKKPTETTTLMVSDLLPDLSEEVRKQAGKKVQSNAKTETVYFLEGYDVSTLKVDLPELPSEIVEDSAYVSKPSAIYDIVDNSYEVQKLKIASELPDLQDVLANPEKYERKVEKNIVDEKALLNNISDVKFKPFSEGQEFEVLNNYEEALSVDDVQKEMSQFEKFEVVEDVVVPTVEIDEYDDFEALYNNEYVDLDNIENKDADNNITDPNGHNNKTVMKRATQPLQARRERSSLSDEVLKKIVVAREERKQLRKSSSETQKIQTKRYDDNQVQSTEIKCIFAGESYNVLSSVELLPNVGCHLAKNANGYTVLGYVGDKICALKQYDELKSEKIQARKSDDVTNGISRYIVRIGLVKFIVNVAEDSIEHVMDLC